MSKELELLEKIEDFLVNIYDDYGFKHEQCLDTRKYIRKSFDIDTIETALKENESLKTDLLGLSQELLVKNKALEIIKVKNVCIHDLKKSKTLEEYNGCREWEEQLTQEEYDLLKEVLL